MKGMSGGSVRVQMSEDLLVLIDSLIVSSLSSSLTFKY